MTDRFARAGRFVRACTTADVPLGEGRTAIVAGVRVALFHTVGGWFCLDAVCPHRGGPLADGLVADRSVICPLHARRFDLATGVPLGHVCEGLAAHAVEVRDDEVYVCIRTVAAPAVAA